MNQGSHFSFDQFAARYFCAPEDLKRNALAAAKRVLDGEVPCPADEPLYALNELPRFFGLKHYTTLARLEVGRVGVSYGGRRRYRLSDVKRWLQSPECQAIRQRLREKRKAHDQKTVARTSVGGGDVHQLDGGRP